VRSRRIITAAVVAGLVGGLLVGGAAEAGTRHKPGHHDGKHAVFVQTNKRLGNTIVVYRRDNDGDLSRVREVPTGGLGGATAGPAVDALASQGSLIFQDDRLFAVNAGSNTITMFRVKGDKLERLQVIWSGGLLPVSIAVRKDLVYVLNAGGAGAVQGYRLEKKRRLVPIKDGRRSLGLNNANPPDFATSPAQVGISPNGRFVLVSTKALNTIVAFAIGRGGNLARHPVVNTDNGGPFGFTFDKRGKLVVSESTTNAATRFRLRADGGLTQIGPSVPSTQLASCWIERVGRFFYVSNPGSSTISSYTIGSGGNLILLDATAATTEAAPIDMTTSGGFLYVQNAVAGKVHGYKVNRNGTLTPVTTVTGLPMFANGIGMEGIAAS
jgi:6-phosphogluconolactonase (cycloisomerase 2 family)